MGYQPFSKVKLVEERCKHLSPANSTLHSHHRCFFVRSATSNQFFRGSANG